MSSLAHWGVTLYSSTCITQGLEALASAALGWPHLDVFGIPRPQHDDLSDVTSPLGRERATHPAETPSSRAKLGAQRLCTGAY